MEKKLTKVEKFAMVKAILEGVESENRDMLIEFVDHEVELLAGKGKSENTKKAKEIAESMNVVFSALVTIGKPVTVTELIKGSPELAEFSNQKVSAMLKKLVDQGTVVKTPEKKVSYFSVVAKEVAE